MAVALEAEGVRGGDRAGHQRQPGRYAGVFSY